MENKEEILSKHIHIITQIQTIMEKNHNITPELCKLLDLYSNVIKEILEKI